MAKKIKIRPKDEKELVDRFEDGFDRTKKFDPIPFHVKRSAAEVAARAALNYLETQDETVFV